MARFTTRVQLNGRPTAEDYEDLHRAMRRRGFTRIIQAEDGKKYWLPHAEFNREADTTRAAVLEDAEAAAATISTDYGILVTESAGRTWHGLTAATAADAVAS
ncbi:MAG: hypothetical protein ABSG86_23460 [Thermoguttaceae bacterium]